MDESEKYAILTAKYDLFGEIDIKVSRYVPLKEIIRNLFDALECTKQNLKGYYAKAEKSQTLLEPTDTLQSKDIYDGDILHIL